MRENQATIGKEVSISGIGLHSGEYCTVKFKPAPPNNWVTFVRVDLEDKPVIKADIEHVIDISRGTTLGVKDAKVMTVEHLLAALAGLQIDNVIIEVDNVEVPVLDGSAKPFVDLLLEAGIVEQDVKREYLELSEPLSYSNPEKKVDVIITPSDEFRVTFLLDFGNSTLGTQYTFLESLEKEFVKEFASARTFCFLHEIEMLKDNGLIKGGSLDNAVVYANKAEMTEERLDELARKFNWPGKLEVSENNILGNVKLRYYNEAVRHKVVDILGDLFLLGFPLKCHVLAARSGHAANVELVKKMRSLYEKNKIIKKYQKEATVDYVLDINAIMKILPHAYPFLLVDRILKLDPGKFVSGLKNVTINEPFFPGHFPGHPIMPGVLQLEAMGQVGGVLLLNSIEHPENYLVYFTGMEDVKFRKKVLPGDQIIFELYMEKFRRNMAIMQGTGKVNGEIVCQATLKAAIVEKNN